MRLYLAYILLRLTFIGSSIFIEEFIEEVCVLVTLLLNMRQCRGWIRCYYLLGYYTYIHIYHSRFLPEGVAEASQIFLRDAHVLPKYLAICNTADITGGKPIAV
jgi:hypothetical protein